MIKNLGMVCTIFFLAFLCQSYAQMQWTARLELNKDSFDFGRVEEGVIAEHIFNFTNVGNAVLKIENVKTSCGCTAALMSSKVINAGESGELKVTLNTNNKNGKIHKVITIYSNDSQEPVKQISVHADVVQKESAGAHKDDSVMHGSYFEGKCVNCHVDQGVGKYGIALYNADCAMCHGTGGNGVKDLTTALNDPKYLATVSDEELYRIIENGTSNPMMLGFSKNNGGPLDDLQLNSLVEYIRNISKVTEAQSK